MNYLFLIQQRSTSTRLPGKALMPVSVVSRPPGSWRVDDCSLAEMVYRRVHMSDAGCHSCIYLVIPEGDEDLKQVCSDACMDYREGPENDVYERFASVLKRLSFKPDYFFRVCGDNPCLDPGFIDEMVNRLESFAPEDRPDYLSYMTHDGTPAMQMKAGLFCEAIKTTAFLENPPVDQYGHDHVTPQLYMPEHCPPGYVQKTEFGLMPVSCEDLHLSVDTQEDLDRVRAVFNWKGDNFTWREL